MSVIYTPFYALRTIDIKVGNIPDFIVASQITQHKHRYKIMSSDEVSGRKSVNELEKQKL